MKTKTKTYQTLYTPMCLTFILGIQNFAPRTIFREDIHCKRFLRVGARIFSNGYYHRMDIIAVAVVGCHYLALALYSRMLPLSDTIGRASPPVHHP